jgi:asparagine synthase (glutamine-hydrolysing)
VFSDEMLERLLCSGNGAGHDALADAFAGRPGGDSLSRMIAVDLATQLPDDLLLLTDRMTMATSLECRVPLLDDELVELAARMPSRLKIRGGELKHLLKRALAPLLPPGTLQRKKRGFGAPIGAWIKHELAPLTRLLLSREVVERRGLLRAAAVHETLALHTANREDHTDHLLALINLELWCRLHLDGQSAGEATRQIEAELRR